MQDLRNSGSVLLTTTTWISSDLEQQAGRQSMCEAEVLRLVAPISETSRAAAAVAGHVLVVPASVDLDLKSAG